MKEAHEQHVQRPAEIRTGLICTLLDRAYRAKLKHRTKVTEPGDWFQRPKRRDALTADELARRVELWGNVNLKAKKHG